jgi:hypothetical protein
MKKFAVIPAAVLVATMLIIAGCDSKPKTPAMNMADGLWEITMKVDMPGMPPAAMKPMSITTCLTKKDFVPKGKNESNCEVKNISTMGDTVTWETVCKNVSSKGSATYAGTTFTGSSETTVQMEGQTKIIKTAMDGKYIGACPDKK